MGNNTNRTYTAELQFCRLLPRFPPGLSPLGRGEVESLHQHGGDLAAARWGRRVGKFGVIVNRETVDRYIQYGL